MKLKLFFTLAFIGFIKLSSAQNSSIKGTVIDEKTGETLPGAIVLVEGTITGGNTDLDGVFTINNLKPGKYTLVSKLISYNTKILTDVIVKSGEPTILTISLGTASMELGVVEIVATMSRETTNAMLVMQKNNAAVSDGISSESIKRTPDRNTSDVLKRISGASIQDNKFAIIRGLNDRYNAAYINGAPLPSSESDRKAFAFDIFPSNMLDNLVITKTATPDMPGEFAGGIIQINTKSIPEKNFQSLSIAGGYNTITTGKQQITYKGGKTDWLGIDDGARAMPSEIPDKDNFPKTIAEQAELAKKTNVDWALQNKKFSPNCNIQYSTGYLDSIKSKPLGVILALTYNRTNTYNETIRRGYTGNGTTNGTEPSQIDFDYLDKAYAQQLLAGALANLSLKLNNNNTINFKNLYSINTDDRVIARSGETNPLESNPTLLKSTARWFTSNKIYTGQLNGEHLLPKSKIRISWDAGLSSIKREIPNLRRSIYTRFKTFNDPGDPNLNDTMYTANIAYSNVGPSYGGSMFFSENKENIYSLGTDATYGFKIGDELKNDIKIGVFYQNRSRTFFARQLGYTRYGVLGGNISFKDSLLQLDEDHIFENQNMGLLYNGAGGFKLMDGTKYSDNYNASSTIQSAYLMLDTKYKILRIVYGARLENFSQKLIAVKANKTPLNIVTKKLDVLPSANLIIGITEKQNIRLSYSHTLNRPEYRELAPFAFYDFNTQFVISGNDSLKRAKIHNADLRYEFYPGRGQLFSVSFFYKEFIDPIEQISRPDVINEMSFKNIPKAINYGVEIEFRILLAKLFRADSSKFLNNLTLFSNLAVIRSKVDVKEVIGAESENRPLQGQSPYVFNTGLQYIDSDLGMTFSISFNKMGERIAIVGNVGEPTIWENSRAFLDMQLTKNFLKNKQLEMKLNIQNIVAQQQVFYQNRDLDGSAIRGTKEFFNSAFSGDSKNKNGLNKNEDDQIWVTKYAPTLSFGISYKF